MRLELVLPHLRSAVQASGSTSQSDAPAHLNFVSFDVVKGAGVANLTVPVSSSYGADAGRIGARARRLVQCSHAQ